MALRNLRTCATIAVLSFLSFALKADDQKKPTDVFQSKDFATCTIEEAGLRLRISVPSHSVPGDSVPVAMELTNVHDEIARFVSYGPDAVSISVQDNKGKEPLLTDLGKSEYHLGRMPDMTFLELHAKETHAETHDLKRWFKLPPGRYTVTIARPFNDSSEKNWGELRASLSFNIGDVPNPFLDRDRSGF